MQDGPPRGRKAVSRRENGAHARRRREAIVLKFATGPSQPSSRAGGRLTAGAGTSTGGWRSSAAAGSRKCLRHARCIPFVIVGTAGTPDRLRGSDDFTKTFTRGCGRVGGADLAGRGRRDGAAVAGAKYVAPSGTASSAWVDRTWHPPETGSHVRGYRPPTAPARWRWPALEGPGGGGLRSTKWCPTLRGRRVRGIPDLTVVAGWVPVGRSPTGGDDASRPCRAGAPVTGTSARSTRRRWVGGGHQRTTRCRGRPVGSAASEAEIGAEGLAGASQVLFVGQHVGCGHPPGVTDERVRRGFAFVGDRVRRRGGWRWRRNDHERRCGGGSNVPQLAASELNGRGQKRGSERQRRLAGLAARRGAFRDMTRIASRPSGIWPDIFCLGNRDAHRR